MVVIVKWSKLGDERTVDVTVVMVCWS